MQPSAEQPNTQETTKPTIVVVHSFDVDGSLWNFSRILKQMQEQLNQLTALYKNNSINSIYDLNNKPDIQKKIQDLQHQIILKINDEFIKELRTQMMADPSATHISMLGSNRQSTWDDYVNWKKKAHGREYIVGSCFKLIEQFSETLGMKHNPFQMPDLNLYGDKSHIPGYTYIDATTTIPSTDQDPYDKAPGWEFDDQKITLLYAQMQTIANEYKDNQIVFNFYDDTENILSSLYDFYTQHPEFIPENVILKLHHYNGQLNQTANYPYNIRGTGNIDTNCRQTVQELVKHKMVTINAYNDAPSKEFLNNNKNQYVYNKQTEQLLYVTEAGELSDKITLNAATYTTKIKDGLYLIQPQLDKLDEIVKSNYNNVTTNMCPVVNIPSATNHEITQIGINSGLQKSTIQLEHNASIKKEESQQLPSAQAPDEINKINTGINEQHAQPIQPVAQVPPPQADNNPEAKPKNKRFILTSIADLETIAQDENSPHKWVLNLLANQLSKIQQDTKGTQDTMLPDGTCITDPNNSQNTLHLNGITLISRESQSEHHKDDNKISFVAINPTQTKEEKKMSGSGANVYKSIGTFAIKKTLNGPQKIQIRHWADNTNDSKKMVKVITQKHITNFYHGLPTAQKLQTNEISFGKPALRSSGGQTNNTELFIIMKRLKGLDLLHYIHHALRHDKKEGAYKRKIELFQKILLAYKEQIRQPQLLHRDIKPENIFTELNPDGGVKNVKFIDFGLAIKTTDTNVNANAGTHGYVHTNCYSSTAQPSISYDAYALGIVFWEMLDYDSCQKFQAARHKLLNNPSQYSQDKETQLLTASLQSLPKDIIEFLTPLLTPSSSCIKHESANEYLEQHIVARFEKIVVNAKLQYDMLAALGIKASRLEKDNTTPLQPQLESLYQSLCVLKTLYNKDDTQQYYAQKLKELHQTAASIQPATTEHLTRLHNKLALITTDLETFATRSALITAEIQKISPYYPTSTTNTAEQLTAITPIHQALNNHPDLEINQYTSKLKTIKTDNNFVQQCEKIVNNIEYDALKMQQTKLRAYEVLNNHSTVIEHSHILCHIKDDNAPITQPPDWPAIHNQYHGLNTTFLKNIQEKINTFKKTWWGGAAKAKMIEDAVQACPLHLLNYDMFDETKKQPQEVMRVLKALAYKRIGFGEGYEESNKEDKFKTAANAFKDFKKQYDKNKNLNIENNENKPAQPL